MSDDILAETYHVLVVDDEPIVHQMMKRIIEGCELPVELVGTASSGAQAIELARQKRPHIILMDIQMAEMNGLEVGEFLAISLDYKPLIIYVTAHRKFDYAQQAISVGAVAYLVKPIRREAVIEALGKAVNQLQAARLEHLENLKLRERLQLVMPGVVPASGPAEETRRAAVARAAREYVEEHYAEDITLCSAADHLNLSSGHLGAIFKSEYSISFKAYLRRVRIARAKEMMRDHRLNLSEIAQRVGYEDVSYFSHSFLEETGVRPSEYRGEGRRWQR